MDRIDVDYAVLERSLDQISDAAAVLARHLTSLVAVMFAIASINLDVHYFIRVGWGLIA